MKPDACEASPPRPRELRPRDWPRLPLSWPSALRTVSTMLRFLVFAMSPPTRRATCEPAYPELHGTTHPDGSNGAYDARRVDRAGRRGVRAGGAGVRRTAGTWLHRHRARWAEI